MKSDKKMTVFISWSQKKSNQIAKILKEELYRFFSKKIEFWVSDQDIANGAFFANSIMTALRRSQMAIICLDRSNYKKPWIYFETGGIVLQNYDPNDINQAILLPIIFDNLKPEAFSGTPFGEMQLSLFDKEHMWRVVQQINSMYEKVTGDNIFDPELLSSLFDRNFTKLRDKIDSVYGQSNDEVENMITGDNVADLISNYKEFPTPTFGDVIRYESGFETSPFYRFLLENVKKRLYIFGRKNIKLSSAEFDLKFADIVNRGLDVKLLFLNPESELAKTGIAQDRPNFRNNLLSSIIRFKDRYKSLNADIDTQCKMYDKQRDCHIIVADNVVFYKELTFTPKGRPEHFTDSPFTVTSVNTGIGMSFVNKFYQTWNDESTPFPRSGDGEDLSSETKRDK